MPWSRKEIAIAIAVLVAVLLFALFVGLSLGDGYNEKCASLEELSENGNHQAQVKYVEECR